MTAAPIPEDIRHFLQTTIPSIPHLEALLLLRTETERPWDMGRLARRLYVSETVADKLLAELCSAGVLAFDGSTSRAYRYQPRSDALRQLIDRLASIYARSTIDVTHLIHSGKKAR